MKNGDDISRKLLARTNYGKPIVFGLAGVLMLGGAFAGWAATAPIAGAAIAEGNFVVRGQNKVIQHLEGGIVSEIAVKEGSIVKAGDMLARLDTTQARAELQRAEAQFGSILAQEARLLAVRDGLDAIPYPAELLDKAKNDPIMADLMADQEKEFRATKDRREKEISILSQKIEAQKAEIAGYTAQSNSTAAQSKLVDEEMSGVKGLFDKGLMTQERLFNMRRMIARFEGDIGNYKASIARLEQNIIENREEIEKLANDSVEDAAGKIVDLRQEKAKLAKEITQYRDTVARSVVRSPVDGVVFKLHVNTIGAVLSQGGTIMELLPYPADLVVEARVQPTDIDRVSVNQAAAIRIPALHIPYSPLIPAKVEYVSADRTVDENTGEVYYLARISGIDLPSDIDESRLYAGMPVESFVLSEERTFAEYIIDPLWQSFSRSLRED